MSQETPYIFDATTADFDQSVIENSFHKPVLVDFWAEWCAPCKSLMPLLQTIAESYQGELLLAKVNCDLEQDIVARFGIRSLPTVVLFKDGQPVDGFAGAQPESAVRAMLEPHVQMPPPAAADPFEHAQALFDDIRCVVCQHESIADSPAGVAGDMRRLIREEIAAGADDAAVRADLVRRFGDYVLFRPPLRVGTLLLWFGPFLLAAGAALALVRRGRRKAAAEPAPLSAEEERRLDDLLAQESFRRDADATSPHDGR